MTFKGFNAIGLFLQVKPCTEAPNLHQTDQNRGSLVELGGVRIPAPFHLQSAPPWCPGKFLRALGASVEHSWKAPGPFPNWSPSTGKIASS